MDMSDARNFRAVMTNLPHYEARLDLAAPFRWTARLNVREAVANHFSLAVDEAGCAGAVNFFLAPESIADAATLRG